MTYINPIVGAFAGSGQVQKASTDTKDRVVRREADVRQTASATQDRFDHEVESGDAVILSENDDHPSQQRNKKKKRPQTEEPGAEENPLDIRA